MLIRLISIACCVGTTTSCAVPSTTTPLATFSSPSDAGDSALLIGALTLENGCLYLDTPEMPKRWVPVIRAESGPEWKEGKLLFSDGRFADGSTVALGGGESGESDENFRIPSSCDDSPRWRTWTVAPGTFR